MAATVAFHAKQGPAQRETPRRSCSGTWKYIRMIQLGFGGLRLRKPDELSLPDLIATFRRCAYNLDLHARERWQRHQLKSL